MKLSTRGRYACRALLELARYYGQGTVSIDRIAEKQAISKRYLEHIFARLREADIVTGTRGSKGGYVLNRAPAEISAGEVVASGSPEQLRERVTADSSLIAEIRGPKDEVVDDVRALSGVSEVSSELSDGWNRLKISAKRDQDVREPLYKLVAERNWSLRELRRETASLEEFFVQITAQQSMKQAGG